MGKYFHIPDDYDSFIKRYTPANVSCIKLSHREKCISLYWKYTIEFTCYLTICQLSAINIVAFLYTRLCGIASTYSSPTYSSLKM